MSKITNCTTYFNMHLQTFRNQALFLSQFLKCMHVVMIFSTDNVILPDGWEGIRANKTPLAPYLRSHLSPSIHFKLNVKYFGKMLFSPICRTVSQYSSASNIECPCREPCPSNPIIIFNQFSDRLTKIRNSIMQFMRSISHSRNPHHTTCNMVLDY